MKYRVRNNKNISLLGEGELLKEVLKDRGVSDPSHYLNLTDDDIFDGMLLRNMYQGLCMLNWHIANGKHIHIIADPDVDGSMSFAVMYQYIKKLNPNVNVTFSMNDGKKHGIIRKCLEEYLENDMLIIAPDCGTNDREEVEKILGNYDLDILTLDHHQYEESRIDNLNDDRVALINNQDGSYPNSTLSGVGVVYKFIKEYDKLSKNSYADKFLDLVAIGMIGDGMDLRNYETRRIVDKGLANINNKFIQEILMSRDYSKPNSFEEMDKSDINIKKIAWQVAPLINGVIRSGTDEERRVMLEALVGKEEMVEYQGRRVKGELPPPVLETWEKHALRVCTSIKGKQDRAVRKCMEIIEKDITDEYLKNNKIVIYDASNIEDMSSEFSGLVSGKLAGSNRIKRPVFLLRKKDSSTYGGSARNYSLFEEQDTRTILEESELGHGMGHPNSFGLNIPIENVDKIQEYFNDRFKDIKIEDVYTVDYKINLPRLKEKDIITIGKYSNIFGSNILQKPTFVIENVEIPVDKIMLLGSKRNFLKMEKNIGDKTFTFCKSSNQQEYDEILGRNIKGIGKAKKSVTFNIICEFSVNRFNNVEKGQIDVIDYEIIENSSKKRSFF